MRQNGSRTLSARPSGQGCRSVRRRPPKPKQKEKGTCWTESVEYRGSGSKLLYAVRVTRFDLLRPIGSFATRITKWDTICDQKLHRLMEYVFSTVAWRQVGYVGDALSRLSLELFVDADFSNQNTNNKSTSGLLLRAKGKRSNFPLTAQSRRQPYVSVSTWEAELVAIALGLKNEGLPILSLWGELLATVAPELTPDTPHEGALVWQRKWWTKPMARWIRSRPSCGTSLPRKW